MRSSLDNRVHVAQLAFDPQTLAAAYAILRGRLQEAQEQLIKKNMEIAKSVEREDHLKNNLTVTLGIQQIQEIQIQNQASEIQRQQAALQILQQTIATQSVNLTSLKSNNDALAQQNDKNTAASKQIGQERVVFADQTFKLRAQLANKENEIAKLTATINQVNAMLADATNLANQEKAYFTGELGRLNAELINKDQKIAALRTELNQTNSTLEALLKNAPPIETTCIKDQQKRSQPNDHGDCVESDFVRLPSTTDTPESISGRSVTSAIPPLNLPPAANLIEGHSSSYNQLMSTLPPPAIPTEETTSHSTVPLPTPPDIRRAPRKPRRIADSVNPPIRTPEHGHQTLDSKNLYRHTHLKNAAAIAAPYPPTSQKAAKAGRRSP